MVAPPHASPAFAHCSECRQMVFPSADTANRQRPWKRFRSHFRVSGSRLSFLRQMSDHPPLNIPAPASTFHSGHHALPASTSSARVENRWDTDRSARITLVGATTALAGLAIARRVRSQRHTARRRSADPRTIAGANAELLTLRTSDLKQELRVRGLDTSTSFDRAALLELGVRGGVLPPDAAPHAALDVRGSSSVSRGRRRRRTTTEASSPSVVVSLQRVLPQEDMMPAGPFTDGERLALPFWSESAGRGAEPLWFLLDPAIRQTVLSETVARRLGVEQGGPVRGLRFGSEHVQELQAARIVPDGATVLGARVAGQAAAGMLGLDFLHGWDIDLDIAGLRCSAWRAGSELATGFGVFQDALEIECAGSQGLLEIGARLRGTACSGPEREGPVIRTVVDLGQTHSSCNWAAARQVGVDGPDAPCVRAKMGVWMGLDGQELEVCEAEMSVQLPGRSAGGVLPGARVCERRLFWIADSLPLLEKLGFNQLEPCAILGLDAVGRSRLALSARHRRLFIPA